MKFSTKTIHIGQQPDKETGAIIPPVYLTSTYKQEAPNQHKGYDYTRAGNPNFTNLEATLSALEDAVYATVFASGLSAVTAISSMLKQGDCVLAADDLYGGTFRLYTQIFSRFGICFELVDMASAEKFGSALHQLNSKIVLIETPTNPLLKVIDIRMITDICRKAGVLTVVDNTLASPYFQRPICLGADVVLHSSTKYIGGHSDVIGGALITNSPELKQKFDFARMSLGLNPSPFDTWLLSRSLKTLEIRMEKHQSNALRIVSFLASHSKVKRIYYPETGKESNSVASKQMSGFGGIISVEFNLDQMNTEKLISSFEIFRLAESLGGVESLVDHPASMTHASIPKVEREKMGLSDGLVRFSVGIEDADDLVEDLKKALDRIN